MDAAVLYLRRESDPRAKPSVIETDLPGHLIDEEFRPEYLSFIVSGENSKADQPVVKEHRDWLQRAKDHKEKGNSIFRASDKFKAAEKEYRRALHCLRRCARTREVEDMRVALYLNLTACDLGVGDHASARSHSTKAIKLDPNNVKAYFRRAQAKRHAAFDLDGAAADLESALRLAPNDEAIVKAIAMIKNEKSRIARKESQMAKKMFS